MKHFSFYPVLFLAVLLTVTIAEAGPVRLSDVRQVVNSNPGRQSSSGAGRLVVSRAGNPSGEGDGDNRQTVTAQQQDSRVIVEDDSVVIEEEPCNCPEPIFGTKPFVAGAAFPWWALGLGGVPLAFVGGGNDNGSSPTPTPSPTPAVSPTPVASATPVMSPTPIMSPTPMVSPSGTPPQTVPEPMTILLFGTGLSGIGLAARRRWQRAKGHDQADENETDENENLK